MASTDTTPATGRCRCGTVRWRVDSPALAVSYCHCADCRRATGAPVTVFVGFAAERISFEEGRPQAHSRHAGVERLFCGGCGSPIGYRDAGLPGELYFYLGVMDEPERYRPQCHAFIDEAWRWLSLDDDLLRHQGLSRARQ
ncbi:GFA family protein [Salinisphaera sp. SPP-AMP-43]|uniref:GFA family protein n=1 Tax=Salinisphaera sp. SPP-AMP-43 TaxID=3121288 RepID=UPI003C6E6A9D